MNRRHFFKSLAALTGAASASPLIFIPKFEPVRWKRQLLTQQMLDEAVASFTVIDEHVIMQEPIWDAAHYYGTWKFLHSF